MMSWSEQDAARIGDVIQRVEGMPRFDQPVIPVAPNGDSIVQFVQLTSATVDGTSGYYAGNWLLYDAVAKTWTAQTAVWVAMPNGETPSTSSRYPALLVGLADGLVVYMVLVFPGTFLIDRECVSGSPVNTFITY